MHTPAPINPTTLSELCEATRGAMAQGWEIYLRHMREGMFGPSVERNRQASIMVEGVAEALAAIAICKGRAQRSGAPIAAMRVQYVRGEWDLELSMTPVIAKSALKFLRSELKSWGLEGESSSLTVPLVTSAMVEGLTKALSDDFSAEVVRSAVTHSLQECGASVSLN